MHTAYASYEPKVSVTFSSDNACVEPPPGMTVTVGEVRLEPPAKKAARTPTKPHKVAAKPDPKSDWDLLDLPKKPTVQASPYAAKLADNTMPPPTCRAGIGTRQMTPHPLHKPFAILGEAPRGGLLVPLASKPSSRDERDATAWLPYAIGIAEGAANERDARKAIAASMDSGLAAGIRESFAHARLNPALTDAISRIDRLTWSQDALFRVMTGAAYDRLAADRATSATAVAAR